MIGVLGAGSWGTAIAILLAKNLKPQNIPLWDKDLAQLALMEENLENKRYLPGIALPGTIKYLKKITDLLSEVQDIVIAVPSHAFKSLLIEKLKPNLQDHHRILWVTKGMEPGSGRFLHQLVEEKLGMNRAYAVLSGPSFAREVALGMPTAVTVSSNNEIFTKDIVKYFHSDAFRVYLNKDIIGVQFGGVIKNILAVACGISDGLNFGANARAGLITRGIAEMQRLGAVLGAKSETLVGLSGLGDVILTCTDNQSRNRRFGLAIAKGHSIQEAQDIIGQVVEAVHNTKEICDLAEKLGVEVPIANQVNFILQQKITPRQAAYYLLSREPVQEGVL